MAFKKFFKKIAAALAAGAMMVAMAVPAMAADLPIEGGSIELGNWKGYAQYTKDQVTLKAGDVVTVTYKDAADAQIGLQTGSWENLRGEDADTFVDITEAAGTVEFKITQADVDTLEAGIRADDGNYLVIKGKNATITAITVNGASAADTTTAAAADSKTGDSANVGLILAIAAAVVAVGATVVIKKREAVER